MDNFTQNSLKHGVIFEWLATFQGLEQSFEDCGFKQFQAFLAENIPDHFQFEEDHWFPIIDKEGTPAEIEFIQGLVGEHRLILQAIREYDSLLAQLEAVIKPVNNESLVKLKDQISQSLFGHAQKEDLELYPILKKYQAQIQLCADQPLEHETSL